jgi:hypothetical protein
MLSIKTLAGQTRQAFSRKESKQEKYDQASMRSPTRRFMHDLVVKDDNHGNALG